MHQGNPHLSGPIDIQVPGKLISFIQFKGERLYYDQEKLVTFESLNSQYKQYTNQTLKLVFNDLSISLDMIIQQLLQSQEEIMLFQRIIGLEGKSITLDEEDKKPFNLIVYRIMKWQENDKHNNENKAIILEKKASGKMELSDKIQDLLAKTKKVIYWIDDQPGNNYNLIQKWIRPKGIEVIQVTSTFTMKKILQKNIKELTESDMQLMFISDMTRKQGNNWNSEAGVDLFEHLYNQLNLTFKGVFFVGDQAAALNKIIKRNVKKDYLRMAVTNQEVLTHIFKEFKTIQQFKP